MCSLHKIEKYSKEIGGKSGKLSTKSRRTGTFLWTLHPPLYRILLLSLVGLRKIYMKYMVMKLR